MVKAEKENAHQGVREALEVGEVVLTGGEEGGPGMRKEIKRERRKVMTIVRTAAPKRKEIAVGSNQRGMLQRLNLRVLQPLNLLHHHHLLVKGSPPCRLSLRAASTINFFHHQLKPAGKSIRGL